YYGGGYYGGPYYYGGGPYYAAPPDEGEPRYYGEGGGGGGGGDCMRRFQCHEPRSGSFIRYDEERPPRPRWGVRRWRKKNPGGRPGFSVLGDISFAEFAGWEVAAVHRLRKEFVLPVCPELADGRVGLDHGVPQLGLVVPEQLFLLDLLDVDVLDRVAHVIE